MKILLSILLLLLLTGCDETKKEYHSNNQLMWETKRIEGSEILTSKTWYYETGELHLKEIYKDDKRDGELLEYYKSGNILIKVPYKDDKRDGESFEYYESGEVSKKIQYKDGKRDGESLEYYKSGNISKKTQYKNALKDGESFKYYESGKVSKKTQRKDSEVETIKTYNEAGKLLKTTYIKRVYYPSGKLERVIPYINGKKDGIEKSYFQNGYDVKFETPYKNGKVHGTIYRYNQAGNPISSTPYENGVQLRDSQWYR